MELIGGVTRHDFLNRAATVSGAVAVGIFAFPQVLEAVEAVSASVLRVTRPYTAFRWPLWPIWWRASLWTTPIPWWDISTS